MKNRRPVLIGRGAACLVLVLLSSGVASAQGSEKLVLMQKTGSLLAGDTLEMLWLSREDGSSLRPWIAGSEPEWSPNGDAIAFSAPGTGGAPDVFVLTIAGKEPVNVTRSRRSEAHPAWSPDGSELAVSVADGGIALVDVATRQSIDLAQKEGANRIGRPMTIPWPSSAPEGPHARSS